MKYKTIITYSKNEYQRIGNMVHNMGGMAFWCYQRYNYILMLLFNMRNLNQLTNMLVPQKAFNTYVSLQMNQQNSIYLPYLIIYQI